MRSRIYPLIALICPMLFQASASLIAQGKVPLRCIPEKFHKGDTLTLVLSAKHPAELGLTTPDNRYFYLVYDRVDSSDHPLMSRSEFAPLRTFRIPTGSFRLYPYEWKAKEQEVFVTPGVYTFTIGDNLETELDIAPVFKCSAKLLPVTKK